MHKEIEQRVRQGFAKIEADLAGVSQLSDSERKRVLESFLAQLDSLANDIENLQRTGSQALSEQLDAVSDDLRRRVEGLLHPKKASAVAGAGTGAANPRSADLRGVGRMAQEQVGLVREKNKNILRVIDEMNSEIGSIEKEIRYQRERLESTRDKVSRTQALVHQTKRALKYFSQTLYQDKLIKVLIGLIAVAIVAILIAAVFFSSKRTGLKTLRAQLKVANERADFKTFREEDFEQAFQRLSPLQNLQPAQPSLQQVKIPGSADENLKMVNLSIL